MPGTVDEILKHADELAARFENYEPSPDDELDVAAVALLQGAVRERSDAEQHVIGLFTDEGVGGGASVTG